MTEKFSVKEFQEDPEDTREEGAFSVKEYIKESGLKLNKRVKKDVTPTDEQIKAYLEKHPRQAPTKKTVKKPAKKKR